MISKARIKLIHSLEMRKYRRQENLFVAEGPKLVGELMNAFRPTYLAALPDWLDENQSRLDGIPYDAVTPDELSRASLLKAPQSVVALFPIPHHTFDRQEIEQRLSLALDGVQDPGNLGTIVRIADWFGIEDIFCSQETADIYNPKAVQATMGGLARIRLHYVDLPDFISQIQAPIYGTFLDGENLYGKTLENRGIIVMGNEGNGISPQIRQLVNERLYIPNYPQGRETTESLNVAIATSIICAEFRRRQQ